MSTCEWFLNKIRFVFVFDRFFCSRRSTATTSTFFIVLFYLYCFCEINHIPLKDKILLKSYLSTYRWFLLFPILWVSEFFTGYSGTLIFKAHTPFYNTSLLFFLLVYVLYSEYYIIMYIVHLRYYIIVYILYYLIF